MFKPTNNEGFGDFPKISDNFTKISEDFKNVVRYSNECFRTFSERFRKFPNFPEDIRGKSEDRSINIDKIGLFSIYWKVIFLHFALISNTLSPPQTSLSLFRTGWEIGSGVLGDGEMEAPGGHWEGKNRELGLPP